MKNFQQIISSLEDHKMFAVVEKQLIKKMIRKNKIIGWRNDGIGARLMTYINVARLSKKLNCGFTFYWDTRSDKNAPSYPHNLSTNIGHYLPNLKNIEYFNSKNFKIKNPSISEWKFLILKGESKFKVVKECSEIAKKIFKNNLVKKQKKKSTFNYGLHLRLGDIDAYTRRNYNKNKFTLTRENFNLGKWYPPIFWVEVYKKINSKILLAASDYKEAKKVFNNYNNISYCNELVSRDKNETHKFIFDLISISETKNIICSLASGSGLIIFLISKNKVFTPEAFLNFEKIYFEFYNITLSNYYKFNSLKPLLTHNIRYLLHKIIDFKQDFLQELFKRGKN